MVENVKWFRKELVFKAHRVLYHTILGSSVMKKKKKGGGLDLGARAHLEVVHQRTGLVWGLRFRVEDLGFRI